MKVELNKSEMGGEICPKIESPFTITHGRVSNSVYNTAAYYQAHYLYKSSDIIKGLFLILCIMDITPKARGKFCNIATF